MSVSARISSIVSILLITRDFMEVTGLLIHEPRCFNLKTNPTALEGFGVPFIVRTRDD